MQLPMLSTTLQDNHTHVQMQRLEGLALVAAAQQGRSAPTPTAEQDASAFTAYLGYYCHSTLQQVCGTQQLRKGDLRVYHARAAGSPKQLHSLLRRCQQAYSCCQVCGCYPGVAVLCCSKAELL